METRLQPAVLVFEVAERILALPLEEVDRIVPMAQLARPPGLPRALEGILNLRGAAVSVLRLDRLLDMGAGDAGLYSMIVLLKKEIVVGENRCAVGILADRVHEILPPGGAARVPVGEEDSFNGCAAAILSMPDRRIPVLSSQRLLLEHEQSALAGFHAAAQQRREYWEAGSR